MSLNDSRFWKVSPKNTLTQRLMNKKYEFALLNIEIHGQQYRVVILHGISMMAWYRLSFFRSNEVLNDLSIILPNENTGNVDRVSEPVILHDQVLSCFEFVIHYDGQCRTNGLNIPYFGHESAPASSQKYEWLIHVGVVALDWTASVKWLYQHHITQELSSPRNVSQIFRIVYPKLATLQGIELF